MVILGLLVGGAVAFGIIYATHRMPRWKIAKRAVGKPGLADRAVRATARFIADYWIN